MTDAEHIEKHKELHKSLDELLTDWIVHTNGMPSKATVFELLQWSHKQTIKPDVKVVDLEGGGRSG